MCLENAFFIPSSPSSSDPSLPPFLSLPPPLHLYQGACLFYREWSRPLNTLAEDPEEEKKLMFGMLFSIKGLVAALGSKVSSGSHAWKERKVNIWKMSSTSTHPRHFNKLILCHTSFSMHAYRMLPLRRMG